MSKMVNESNETSDGYVDGNILAVAALINQADSLTRKVLSSYRHDVHYNKNLEVFRTFNCEHLEAAARFFGASPGSNAEKTKRYQNRTTLSDYLIMQLESHFPCKCKGCNEMYAFKLGESPSIRCFLCGQGAHVCDAMAGTPGSIPGSHWICSPCEKKNGITETFAGDSNPDDPILSDSEFQLKISPRVGRSGKKNKKKVNKKEIKNSQTCHVDESQGKIDSSQLQQKESDMITPVGGSTVLGTKNIPELSSEEESTDEDQDDKKSKHPIKSKSKFKNVCERYLLRDCPHGSRGDKLVDGKTCKKEHPQMCLRFSQYGTTRNVGCNKGNNCSYLHPPLCKESEIARVCTNRDCKRTHLKFTRRKEERTPRSNAKKPKDARKPNDAGKSQSGDRKSQSGKQNRPQNTDNKTAPPAVEKRQNKQQDFLMDLMETVRDDILREVRLSLDSMRQEFKGYTPPRPQYLPLSQPCATTPMQFPGALERFRNYSASTPVV